MADTKVVNGIRRPLTPGEAAQRQADEAAWDALERARDRKLEEVGASLDRVRLAVLMDHENRIRALEGQPPLSRPVFLRHVKDLLA